jgi:hypothetical protein
MEETSGDGLGGFSIYIRKDNLFEELANWKRKLSPNK